MPTNMECTFETHPEILAAWVQLNTAIKSRMDLRRYELATVAAAQRLRSSYCSLAHGKVLRDDCGEPLADIVRDRNTAGLDETDVAVMDLAERRSSTTRPRSTTPTGSGCATLGSRTTRSWTSSSQRRRGASSRRRSTR